MDSCQLTHCGMSWPCHGPSLQCLDEQWFRTLVDGFVRKLVLRFRATLTERAPVLQGICAEFRLFFEQAAGVFHVSPVRVRSNSLRIGGVSHYFLTNGSLVSCRWSEADTARIYINDGLAAQAQLHFNAHAREWNDA